MVRRIASSVALALVAAVGVPLSAAAVSPQTWNANFIEGMDDSTDVVVVQPDGKTLIAGASARFDGAPSNLVRLNANGTPDSTFNTNIQPGFNRVVLAIAVQPDGDVVIGGAFEEDGQPASLRRLNADGTPDVAFNSTLGTGFSGGVSTAVYALAVMSDGDVVVGGDFTHLNEIDVPDNLVRLNSDGSVDSSTGFNSALGSGLSRGSVISIATDAEQFVAVGGDFGSLNGDDAVPDGLLVMNGATVSMAYATTLGAGISGTVYSLARSTDNSMYVAGDFSAINQDYGIPHNLVRFTPTGQLDTNFNAALGSGFNDGVFAVAARPDGGVFVGGDFSLLSGMSVPRKLMALLVTGAPDPHFNEFLNGGMNSSGYVYSIAALSNSEVIVSGNLSSVGAYEQMPENIVRLKGPAAPNVPRNVRAIPGNRSATVRWTMPADDGGSAITDVSVSMNPSGSCSEPVITDGRGTSQCTGLVNGSDYTVIVSVTNAVGVAQGTANVRPRTVPGPVRNLRWANPRAGVVKLAWEHPANTGGLLLTAYQLCRRSCDRASNWWSISPESTTSTTTALAKGRRYSFWVRARTEAGPGPAREVTATVRR